MMAVRDRRSELAVTLSAVDLEPKPLGPPEPIRCLTVSIIFLFYLSVSVSVSVMESSWIFECLGSDLFIVLRF